jgi:ribosomal protein S20
MLIQYLCLCNLIVVGFFSKNLKNFKKMKNKPNEYQKTIIDGFGKNAEHTLTTLPSDIASRLIRFMDDNLDIQVEKGTVHGNCEHGYVVSFTDDDGKTFYRYY